MHCCCCIKGEGCRTTRLPPYTLHPAAPLHPPPPLPPPRTAVGLSDPPNVASPSSTCSGLQASQLSFHLERVATGVTLVISVPPPNRSLHSPPTPAALSCCLLATLAADPSARRSHSCIQQQQREYHGHVSSSLRLSAVSSCPLAAVEVQLHPTNNLPQCIGELVETVVEFKHIENGCIIYYSLIFFLFDCLATANDATHRRPSII